MVDPTITYGKGSAVVRMLQYILGKRSFEKALTQYFKDFKYQNVDQYDLWKALEKQGREDGVSSLNKVNLTAAMVEWTRQAGHPVVSVRVEGDLLKLRQNQFFLDSLSKAGKLRFVE